MLYVIRHTLRQPITIALLNYLKPHSIVVIFSKILNLNQPNFFAIVHNGNGRKIAVVIHFSSVDHAGACIDIGKPCSIKLNHVIGICKRIAVLFHKTNLLFQLLWDPDIITVQKRNPLSLRLSQCSISGNRRSTILFIFQIPNPRIRK